MHFCQKEENHKIYFNVNKMTDRQIVRIFLFFDVAEILNYARFLPLKYAERKTEILIQFFCGNDVLNY